MSLNGNWNTEMENVHYEISMLPNWTTHLQQIELVNQVHQFPERLIPVPSSPCAIRTMCNLYQSQKIWYAIVPKN